MANGDFAGHHCKVCYQQALNAKRLEPAPPEDLQGNWDRAVAGNKKAYEAAQARLEAAREANQKDKNCLGYIFAKSCNLPDGVVDHNNPGGFVPLEQLKDYGDWAVMGTGSAIMAGGTPLQLIGSSTAATTIASRLGGTLSLGLIEGGAMMAAGAVLGTIGMLLPNTTSADSAFYTKEQYHALTLGRTRVRVHVQQLAANTINAYGFYTGGKPEWENAQVIEATPRGEQFVADLGQGIEVIWTPAADPNELGIPALEGAPKLPSVWVYPPTEQSNKALVNPVHPPDYQDAIIWFPTKPEIAPIYLSISVRNQPGVVTGIGEDVPGEWLDHARAGLGAPIPTSIADSLRGREFSSFNSFRRAFWVAVSRDPSLAGQFSEDSLSRMQEGKAPRARDGDMVGKRQTHGIHHVEQVSEGGEVYNVDNLRVNTPKNHIDVHKN
ncbi:S-type pyocin domain-containing protein [Pseudomonas lundensis]|uniref:S-type pyocin domain-containing protein n=2 Tax=Pseudomonas lundensis TaxID=86185 RepID=UPI001E30C2B3|nr:S-type pyocin domain-containing protein [Pseudomonas lundensis]